MTRHRRINSRLKQLAETRARATSTIERLERSISAAERELLVLAARIERVSERKFQMEQGLIRHHNEIRAMDKAMLREFPQVEPSKIPATYGFRSEYGKRGGLKSCILKVLEDAGPEGLTAKQVGEAVSEALYLRHNTAEDFQRWMKHSLGDTLSRLRDKLGEVEHIHLQGAHSRWRLPHKEICWDSIQSQTS